MLDIRACSDEELIERLNTIDKNEEYDAIMEYLMDKYKPLVRKASKSYFLAGGDTDDLLQEGMIGLFYAIGRYSQDREASFYSFAKLCIENNMKTAVEKYNRQKHMPLNGYVSISEEINEDMAVEDYGPEDLLLEQENLTEAISEIEKLLSDFEKKVFSLYLDGNDYIKIADILDKEPKAIDNAIQRIRNKRKKIQ